MRLGSGLSRQRLRRFTRGFWNQRGGDQSNVRVAREDRFDEILSLTLGTVDGLSLWFFYYTSTMFSIQLYSSSNVSQIVVDPSLFACLGSA